MTDTNDSSIKIVTATLSGALAGALVAAPKTFSTGSDGYYATGKVVDPATGATYQASMTLVRVGSKPAAKK